MTLPDPTPDPSAAPRRGVRFNSLILLIVLALFVVAGVYVWSYWSASDDSAVDAAHVGPVQPAELPPPDAGAVRATPGQVPAGTDPSGDAVARGVERDNTAGAPTP